MVLELNASNEVVRAYVNGPGMDQPIERIAFINGTPRNRQVFHADGLGSIAALTDASGTTIQTYAYNAFGSIRARTGSDLNRVIFTAREAIGDSLGFYYYRNRVLDPGTGRFTSEDPIGFIDGPNRYVYCANNPMNFTDAFGLTIGNTKGYQGDMCYKPEKGKEIDNVPAGKKSEEQDGFIDPSTGIMYKTTGKATWVGYFLGDDVEVDKDGIVKGISGTSKPVGQEFIDELHKLTPPDKSWDALWQKAQEIKKAVDAQKGGGVECE